MSYALVIFYLDGTLADSFPWFLRHVNGVADRFSFRRIPDQDIEALRGLGPREILRRLEIPFWKLPGIARYMRRLKAAHLADIALFPEAGTMLRALADAGLRLALVSSDHEANARRQLGEAATLFSYFDCGASLFGKPAKFRHILKRAAVGAAQAIAIGDEIRDIEAARAAGMDSGAVAWGYAFPAALQAAGPTHFFSSIEELTHRLSAGDVVTAAGLPE